MAEVTQICRDCGRRKGSGSGRITEWMALCSCSLQPPEEMLQGVRMCLRCQKLVLGGRSGSMTEWVFRKDRCTCETPDVRTLAESSLRKGTPASAATTTD